MSLSDGLQHLGYAARVSLANSVSRKPVVPELVYDAPCFVTEPVPLQNHYPLAVALSTFSGRRWMAALSVKHWVHRFPHLVVSDWEDDDTSGVVGMRWGTGFTWRGLAPVLCLTDALCGRFDWLLFCDDDTAIDAAVLNALVASRLVCHRVEPCSSKSVAHPFARLPWTGRRRRVGSPLSLVRTAALPHATRLAPVDARLPRVATQRERHQLSQGQLPRAARPQQALHRRATAPELARQVESAAPPRRSRSPAARQPGSLGGGAWPARQP